jgi:phenylacetate-coenzyme A ligase PaaK-like adenylate-forming protein
LDTFKSFEKQLYQVNDRTFQDIALSLFRFQANGNAVYKAFVQNLGIRESEIQTITDIPFLPISFFKNHQIKTGEWDSETVFASSGTTGSVTSSHHVIDTRFYYRNAAYCFEQFFGPIKDYNFLALLPSYLERSNSSLVAMMAHFIEKSESPHSGFYLHNTDQLLIDLEKLKRDKRKTILWGVTYALLDLAERFKPDLDHCVVFETGGMKGKRKEVIRQDLHEILKKGFNVKAIYSEYGMTELLSQAYSRGSDRFFCPPCMKVIGRDITDPLHKGLMGETAGINVIDLANIHSIGFIETEDLGKVNIDGSFEVLGRIDNSDVRGCNLMVE